MTTIAAIKINGRIAMAADGGLFHGYEITSRAARKIGHWGPVALAAAGDARTLQAMKDHPLAWVSEGKGPEEIWQEIRELLTRDGYVWKADEDRGAVGCGQVFLLVHGSSLYHICGTGHIHEVPEGEPVAIGCGGEYAIGALEAMFEDRPGLSAPKAVIRAVQISKKWNAYTAGGTLVVDRFGNDDKFTETWYDE